MDIDVEDAAPGIDVIFDCEFRLRDAGEAEEDRDAVEGCRDIRYSVVDGGFVRDVDFSEKNRRLFAFTYALEMLQRFRTHTLVDVEDG